MLKIIMYKDEDYTIKGVLKKNNAVLTFSEEEFIIYIKDNNLTLTKPYMDTYGLISNGFKFRCSYMGLMVGTTSIIDKIMGVK